MFSRTKNVEHREGAARPLRVRGGLSLGAVLSGVVVSFGALFLLSALVGGIMAATGVDAEEAAADATREAGIGAAIAFIAAVFLSYLWGGYAAGRMARGAGLINGLLVPIGALVVGLIVIAIVNAMGAVATLNIPFNENQLPIQDESLVDFGQWVTVASLIAMFVGGILGGTLGQAWHSKLERRAVDDHETEVKERERLAAAERDREERDIRLDERRAAEERAAAAESRTEERVPARRPAVTPPPTEPNRR
jgi:hypothetical protein